MEFKTSSFCAADRPQCVEIARDQEVLYLRDSKSAEGETLRVPQDGLLPYLRAQA